MAQKPDTEDELKARLSQLIKVLKDARDEIKYLYPESSVLKSIDIALEAAKVMRVKDLFEMLSRIDGELPVHIAYNYGDHSRTTVCPSVTGVALRHLTDSDYFKRPIIDSEGAPAIVIACGDADLTEEL